MNKNKYMRAIKFFLSLLLGAFISTLIFLWIASGEIYDYEDTFVMIDDAAQIDVVLCLAGGKGRIAMAAELWSKIKHIREEKKLPAPVLFLSGVGAQATMNVLDDQGVSQAVLKELKPELVIFENVSENTFENVQIFSSFARQKLWKHLLLVTAGYHMRRAQFILQKTLDSEIEIKTATVDSIHFERNEWHRDSYAVRVTMMEYLKWIYYRYSY